MGGPGSTEVDARDGLELVRVAVANEGAFGVLLMDGVPVGPVTLERTYPVAESTPRGPQFVKIPPGRYRCERTLFIGGGYDTYEISGVVGHSRLLFHAGNVEAESQGCILVGQRFGWLGARPGVLSSRPGFVEFMRLTHGRSSFDLLIRDAS